MSFFIFCLFLPQGITLVLSPSRRASLTGSLFIIPFFFRWSFFCLYSYYPRGSHKDNFSLEEIVSDLSFLQPGTQHLKQTLSCSLTRRRLNSYILLYCYVLLFALEIELIAPFLSVLLYYYYCSPLIYHTSQHLLSTGALLNKLLRLLPYLQFFLTFFQVTINTARLRLTDSLPHDLL